MATSEGECWIKLCKKLRAEFELRFDTQAVAGVLGEKKLDKENQPPQARRQSSTRCY